MWPELFGSFARGSKEISLTWEERYFHLKRASDTLDGLERLHLLIDSTFTATVLKELGQILVTFLFWRLSISAKFCSYHRPSVVIIYKTKSIHFSSLHPQHSQLARPSDQLQLWHLRMHPAHLNLLIKAPTLKQIHSIGFCGVICQLAHLCYKEIPLAK